MPTIHRLDEVASTQQVARALLDEGAEHGTLVVARRQTAGRGRLARAWQSGEGGLWLSMVVRGSLPAARAPRLTLGAAALTLEALDVLGAHAAVKWPNDLVLPHAVPAARLGPWRKLGGVLLEALLIEPGHLEGAVLRSAVLGLGLNVRTPTGGFAEELQDVAIALDTAGLSLDVDTVLGALAAPLQTRLLDVIDDTVFAGTLAFLRARSATLGMRVEVDGIAGLAERLDDEGALCVRDDGGVLHTVRAGDVQCMV